MKKHLRILFRISSLLLMLLMLFGISATIPLTADAAISTKVEKSYEIAVVFDNSGSMYQPDSKGDSKAWCRAKYAMEIFASMLSYENGDKLRIYPMWEVTTDGSTPSSGGSFSAIEINSKNDIEKISNLYTVNPNSTPFAPVLEAHEYLKNSSATDKWIIVLTDGEFNQIERGVNVGTLSASDLKNRLIDVATDNIKVQYLGFSEASNLAEEPDKNFFAKKSSDTSLKDDLIGICNAIFQRSVLPDNRLSGTTLNLDLSMKNLIVFAQGPNAKITSLVDESGNEISITLDSGQRKYSEIKALNYDNAQVDTTLAGQVVTFAECPKGKYTLNSSGADAIQIFYEPDVDITATLTNSDGVVVDGSTGEIPAGEYTVNSMIVDSKTGEDVINHELMGNDVDLKVRIKTSDDAEYKEYENGARINLDPDSSTDIVVVGTYLKDYTITSEGNANLFWLKNLKISEPSVDFQIKADVLQSQSWYKIKNHDSWKPIKIAMTLDGQPLTDEQMANTSLSVSISDNLPFRCEKVPGESAYHVFIAQNENGEYVEPETGEYKLEALATYVDEYEKENSSNSGEASFEIQTYDKFWEILIWILAFLVLLGLWLTFMMQKVLPKNIRKDTASFTTMKAGELDASFVEVEYRQKGKSLTIAGSSAVDFDEQCSVTFDLRAVDNRFTKSNRRRVAIIGIDSPCDEMKIAGTPYVNYNGQWIKKNDLRAAESGKTVSPIDQELSCSPRFELSRSGGLSNLTCKTQTTK